MNTPCVYIRTVTKTTCGNLPVMHAPSPPTVVEVGWIISEHIEVREGEGVRLELFAQAFGLYATPIEIRAICVEPYIGIPSGADTISSTDTLEHAIIYHSSLMCLQPTLTKILLS